MRRFNSLFFLIFLVLSLVAGQATFREMNYGLGPRDSSSFPDSETREIAFVANVVDGTVSLLDLANRQIVATLDVTPDGKQLGPARDLAQWVAQDYLQGRAGLNYVQDTDLSRDGEVLFVSRGFLGDVAAFEIGSGDLLWRSPVPGLRADHMTLSPDGTRLYVSALIYSGNRVQVLDSASGLGLGDFEAGQWPHDVHASADGQRIYVASLGDMQAGLPERGLQENAYQIAMADADTLEVTRRFEFDAGVRPFALTRDEQRAYAQLSNAHVVVSYDLVSGVQRSVLQLPVGQGVSAADWDFEAPHHGLALTPDEKTLCLAGRASDYAAIVATSVDPGSSERAASGETDSLETAASATAKQTTHTVAIKDHDAATEKLVLQHIVSIGDAPSWAVIDDSGELCLLANSRSDDISIVSIEDGTEVARVKVGRAPKHITIGRVPTSLLPQQAP